MKKISLYPILVILTLTLYGCEQVKETVPDITQYNDYDMTMELKTFVADDILNVPKSMIYVEGSLYVTSMEGHCVLKYSSDGILEAKMGCLGNGDGEFRSPIAIANYGDDIYIADENDGKIQVFDLEGTYKNTYYVENLNNMYLSVLDMEVDENNIYISVVGGEKKLLHVYMIEKSNGKVTVLGKENMGVLGKDSDNTIYFGQAYDYIEEDGYTGYETGKSSIFNIADSKMTESFLLPDNYAPSDIIVYNDNMYIFSNCYSQIDIFDMQGTYLKTIFDEQSSTRNRGLGYMAMDDEGRIYLSDEENNTIYKLEKKN